MIQTIRKRLDEIIGNEKNEENLVSKHIEIIKEDETQEPNLI